MPGVWGRGGLFGGGEEGEGGRSLAVWEARVGMVERVNRYVMGFSCASEAYEHGEV